MLAFPGGNSSLLPDRFLPGASPIMDERLRSVVSDLREKGSGEAANWLMEHYPVGGANSGEAFTIIPHLSWKRADQVRLAEYYLSGMPFAHAQPYEVFASFMQGASPDRHYEKVHP